MTDNERRKPYFHDQLSADAVLNNAVREKRFSDAVLGSWALTELQMDGIFQVALGIVDPKTDKRFSIVTGYGIQFGEKLRFARETGAITKEEYNKINRFNTLRNALLHTKKKGIIWFFRMSQPEKDEVIQAGWESVNASLSALVRLSARYWPEKKLQRANSSQNASHPSPVNIGKSGSASPFRSYQNRPPY